RVVGVPAAVVGEAWGLGFLHRRPVGIPVLVAALLDQFRDESRPSRLVAGTDPGAVVAVEVLVEEQVIPELRVGLELFGAAEDRTTAAFVPQEDPSEPSREIGRHLPERPLLSRAVGVLHLVSV